jgi:hypothetical protein
MKVKIKLSGGDYYNDNDLIWQGDMPEVGMLLPGSVFVLIKSEIKVALRIGMVAVEIHETTKKKKISAETVYVFYTNGATAGDDTSIKNFLKGKVMEESL